MRSNYRTVLIFALLLHFSCTITAQDSSRSFIDKILSLPDKVFGKIDQQSQKLNNRLTHQTEKYLSKLEKQEQKLKRKLWHTDSLKAKELFGNVEERYAKLREQLNSSNTPQPLNSVYSAHADSLTTVLNFLNENPALKEAKNISKNLSSNLRNVTALQNKFNQTEQIRKQIKARQEALKQQLQNTPLAKQLAKYKKQAYYYQAQLKEYREALNDPKLLGAKLVEVARDIPAFRQFFANNSELSSMFLVPGNNGFATANQASFTGLQTRAGVQSLLQERFGSTAASLGGGGSSNYMQQQMQAAQGQMQQLKDKAMRLGQMSSGNENEELDFVPDQTKTKSLKQRLVFSSSIQTNRSRGFFVNSADIGLSLGMKLNDKSVIGLGGSYRAGLGTGFNNIRLTHEGISYRSYIDWKPSLRFLGQFGKSIWVSGGYERNYFAVFNRIDELRDVNAWKASLLLGASKVVDVRSRFFKKTKLSLLYDFNWRTPGNVQTQPILLRINYQF
ncbi:MAG: hypothetical protein K2X48_03840 [Chitinophagaceae bacterium]|nr:hypothetical protein [Chitinophagaceae bacterium]